MSTKYPHPEALFVRVRLQVRPAIKTTSNRGIFFKLSLGRAQDLERELTVVVNQELKLKFHMWLTLWLCGVREQTRRG